MDYLVEKNDLALLHEAQLAVAEHLERIARDT
jgi:hypothetical protein